MAIIRDQRSFDVTVKFVNDKINQMSDEQQKRLRKYACVPMTYTLNRQVAVKLHQVWEGMTPTHNPFAYDVVPEEFLEERWNVFIGRFIAALLRGEIK